jgi:hypothetical protein
LQAGQQAPESLAVPLDTALPRHPPMQLCGAYENVPLVNECIFRLGRSVCVV